MGENLVQSLAILASYLAFGCFALAMPRNYQLVMGLRSPPKLKPRARMSRRILGIALLLISLAAAVVANDLEFAFPVWVLDLSLGAFGVLATVTWAPHALRWLGKLSEGITI